MKGYWLILSDSAKDQEAQAMYGKLWTPIAEKYSAKFKVLNTQTVLMETCGYTRTLIVEFDSYSQALACYQDEAYQAAKVFAQKASKREFLILEGEPPRG